MDTSPTSTSPQPEIRDLQEQCMQLQQLVSSLLLILIVISGTLSIFLLRQWRFVKAEIVSIEPAANQLIADYANNHGIVEDFVKKCAEYGRTHPDFAPIMAKYRLADYLPKPGTAPVTSTLSTGAPPKH